MYVYIYHIYIHIWGASKQMSPFLCIFQLLEVHSGSSRAKLEPEPRLWGCGMRPRRVWRCRVQMDFAPGKPMESMDGKSMNIPNSKGLENCGPYDSMHVRNWVEKLETFEALSLTELMCVEWDFFLCVDPCWDAQLMI